MDSAKILPSGEIISGFDLWLFDENKVKSYKFVCRGCGIELFPGAYQINSRVRPHFKRSKLEKHKGGCDVEAIDVLKKRAGYRSVKNPNGFPVSYPNKLDLLDLQEIIRSAENLGVEGKNAESKVSSVSDRNDEEAANRKKHNWTARTIRPLCRFFLQFPYDRDQQLNALPATGHSYMTVFAKLKYRDNFSIDTLKIYYGSLSFKKYLETEEKEYVDILLNEGEWEEITDPNDATKTKFNMKNNFKVRIHTKDWKSRKAYVLNSIEVGRREAINSYNNKKNPESKKKAESKKSAEIKAWLFFIGKQDKDDKFLYHVEDHRLICCEPGTMIYPNY